MRATSKVWHIIQQPDPLKQRILVRELGLSPITAQILINRGVRTVEEAKEFLETPLERLSDPWQMKGVREAVSRILEAGSKGEKILIYGDYDADGICSTALLLDILRQGGIEADYYIPNRLEEGYGLNTEALSRAADKGYKLVITVDCGISSRQEVQHAHRLGLEVIITDHHEPPSDLPEAFALINPHLEESLFPFAGVGVAFKLAQALAEELKLSRVNGIFAGDQLDLVTLGTIADVVPLVGENRILVKNGLQELSRTKRVGLKALMEISHLRSEEIEPAQVAFILAPRINAVGRLGNAASAVELLTTESPHRAWELANLLNRRNQERQTVEVQILEHARRMVEREVDLENELAIVLASPLWHSGVIGIVASRLVEQYYRPVVLVALEGEIGKGSARSIPGFHIYEALSRCSHYLESYGGHEQAAGLTIKKEKILEFRQHLNHIAREILPEDKLKPLLHVEAEVLLPQVDCQLAREISLLSPFGAGNPEPLLACRGIKVVQCREVGKNGEHVKLKLRSGHQEWDSIGFDMEWAKELASTSEQVDLAFIPRLNTWNGRRSLQLQLKDVKETEEEKPAVLPVAGEKEILISRLEEALFLPLTSTQRLVLDKFWEKRRIVYLTQSWGHALTLGAAAAGGRSLREKDATLVVFPLRSQVSRFCGQYGQILQRLGIMVKKVDSSFSSQEIENFWNELVPSQPLVVVTTSSVAERYWEKLPLNNGNLVLFAFDWVETKLLQKAGMVISEEPIPEEVTDEVFEEVREENIHFSGKIVESRDCSDKRGYIAGLVERDKSLLVCVFHAKQAVQLAEYFRTQFPQLGSTIMFYHNGMNYHQKRLVWEQFHHHLLSILVISLESLPVPAGTVDDVVFYHCPFQVRDLLQPVWATPFSNHKFKLHLLFNDRDLKMNQFYLDSFFPGREVLVPLYQLLRKSAGRSVIKTTPGKIARALRRRISAPVSVYTVEAGLAILEELELLRQRKEGGKRLITLVSSGKEREYLEGCWRYIEGLREKETFSRLLQWIESRN
ncbi:single-stranded-DNA-specific exonuclease RecJ [Calderihabitans maritimus]|uniref:Single-stranded-DNA-specific exonuclease RecJ n=1 Tax=Calderihabitans maritimus TaxID=1246530 RepID=A0A1Z5HT40_9FIRM|nr:single-stranded-DNA-specific exonuclease RecJ [Calderihabitans maritimus]GAW92699.1 Single-stranded-DNA-specific exonuclease RecJ [Calderihabitans maritimus]